MSIDIDKLKKAKEDLDKLFIIGEKIVINKYYSGTTLRTYVAEQIINKIFIHVKSVLLLLDNGIESPLEFDISLICSSARNVMECTNLYFYLCERGVSNDIFEVRYNIMQLHKYRSEESIIAKMGLGDDSEVNSLRCFVLEHTIKTIKSSDYFAELAQNEKKYVLSGAKPTFKMKSINALDKNIESAVYNLLSNSVHGYPIGLGSHTIKGGAFLSFFDWFSLLMISIYVCRIYVAYAITEYLNLRKRLYSKIDQNEKLFIKLQKNIDDLLVFVEEIKIDYKNKYLL